MIKQEMMPIIEEGLQIAISFPKCQYRPDDTIEFTMNITNRHPYNVSVLPFYLALEIAFIDPDGQYIDIWSFRPHTRCAGPSREDHYLIDLGPGESITETTNLSRLWSFTRTGIHSFIIGYDARYPEDITQPYWNYSYHHNININIVNGTEEEYFPERYWRMQFRVSFDSINSVIDVSEFTDYRFNTTDKLQNDTIRFFLHINGMSKISIPYSPMNESTLRSGRIYSNYSRVNMEYNMISFSIQYAIEAIDEQFQNVTFFKGCNRANGTISCEDGEINNLSWESDDFSGISYILDEYRIEIFLPTGLKLIIDLLYPYSC